jgi:hypothetical protein
MGDFTRNPFNFQHFSSSELAVYLDGQQHGIKPLSTDFANRQYITSVMSLFNATCKENREGNDIDRTDFANGYALYAFDLSPDLSDQRRSFQSRFSVQTYVTSKPPVCLFAILNPRQNLDNIGKFMYSCR